MHNFQQHGQVYNHFTKQIGRPFMIEEADVKHTYQEV